MAYSFLTQEMGADGIAVITINRPEKLNALNAEVMSELGAEVLRCQTASEVKGLIITGAGDKAFVAGADLGEIAAGIDAYRMAARGQAIFRRLELMAKPSIAAINGYALGGGLELAMACTLRVAVSDARLGQPEVKVGLIPGYAGTQRLPRLVGKGRALEMLLTGEPVDAAQAERIGLVNHVVPRAELLPFSRSLLAKILANSSEAVALTMEAVDAGLHAGIEEGSRLEAAAFGIAAATAEARTRIRAFLEKKK